MKVNRIARKGAIGAPAAPKKKLRVFAIRVADKWVEIRAAINEPRPYCERINHALKGRKVKLMASSIIGGKAICTISLIDYTALAKEHGEKVPTPIAKPMVEIVGDLARMLKREEWRDQQGYI